MKQPYLFLLLLAAGFSACVDTIELPRPDLPDTGMFVQGKLLYGRPCGIYASVFRIVSELNNVPQPISTAVVTLEDEQGRTLPIPSSTSGNYFLEYMPENTGFPIVVGAKYRISVRLPGGQQYQSAWEALPAGVKPDSLSLRIAEKEYFNNQGALDNDTFAFFDLHSPLNIGGRKPYFRWEIDQGYKLTDNGGKTCFVVQKLLASNVFILNGKTIGQDRLNAYPLVNTRIDYHFAEGYYLIAYQQTLTENAYGYFDELYQLLSKKGTQFDPPAGEIRTNMSSLKDAGEPVYGFFYAAHQDTVRLYVSPETAFWPKKYCPLPPTNGEAPLKTSCDDCLCELGAGLQKPLWWEF